MRWLNLLSLFLVGMFGTLMVVATAGMRHESHGIKVRLMEPAPDRMVDDYLGDDRIIFLRIDSNKLTINQDVVGEQELPGLVSRIMGTRYRKFLFFYATPESDYRRVAELLSRSQAAVPEMQIVMVTERQYHDALPWRLRLTPAERAEASYHYAFEHPVPVRRNASSAP